MPFPAFAGFHSPILFPYLVFSLFRSPPVSPPTTTNQPKNKNYQKNKGLVEAEVTSALTFGAFFVILFFVEVGKKPLASDNAPPRVYTFSQEK
jgi:hypothetical protein